MDNFTFYAPTYFDFGKGAEKHVADLIKKFGGHKVLLHYGGGSIKKSGLYDTLFLPSAVEVRLIRLRQLLPVLCMMEISWIFIRARHPLRKRFQSERY